VQKRIKQSNDVRLSRLKTLKARDDAMQGVLADCEAKLPSLVKDASYPKLLESLITEGLMQLNDQKVVVKGCAGDEKQVKAALPAAEAAFKKFAEKESGAEWAAGISVTFDAASLKEGVGGVQLTGFEGKITLNNTLKARLDLAFETFLPKLRGALFD